MPIGLDAGVNYLARQIPLRPDHRLVLPTDEITEAMNSRNEQYGEPRLEMANGKWPELQSCELVNTLLGANLLAMPLNPMT